MKIPKLKKLNDESGLVSIVVTVIIMSLLTLMALGFASLAEREKRQALDQQLNSQAFYAAESGINQLIHTGTYTEVSSCVPRNISSDSTVSNTCLLVDPDPQSLEYSDVSEDSSTVFPIKPKTTMKEIYISWQDKDGSQQFLNNCGHNLTDNNQWWYGAAAPRTGILNAMLIPMSEFTSRDDLVSKTYEYKLYPRDSAQSCDSVNDSSIIQLGGEADETKGGFIDGNCNTNNSYYCTVKIEFSSDTSRSYVIRLKSLYRSSTVKVYGKDGSGNPVEFLDAQTEIDSTGKTTDVLRRIKVKIPHDSNKWANKLYPEFAVETADTLCKRLKVGPGFTPDQDGLPAECLLPTN